MSERNRLLIQKPTTDNQTKKQAYIYFFIFSAALSSLLVALFFWLEAPVEPSRFFNQLPAGSTEQRSIIGSDNAGYYSAGNDDIDWTKKESYQGLPVADVDYHPTKNASGMAILIPQIHQSPGTRPSDRRNDAAQINQGEIYQVLSYILDNAAIGFLMVEGEYYGQVPHDDEIKYIQDKLAVLDKLPSQGKEQQRVLIEREIMVEGAPFVLKAEGEPFKLIGAENPDTYKESAQIMRDYIFQKERYQQLASERKWRRPELNTSFWQDVSDLYALVSGSEQRYSAIDFGDAQGNPYGNINDLNKVSSLLDFSEEKVQQIVMDKRNQETASNFSKALQQNRSSLSILQFGAAHERGLVKELQENGLSVIVVTTPQILK